MGLLKREHTLDDSIEDISINELRREYDEISNSYDQLRVKVLALLAGEVAIATFLFATANDIPKVLYGIIFYISGIACLASSFVILLICTRGVMWKTPFGRKKFEQLIEDKVSKNKFKSELRKSYSEAIDENLPKLNSRGALFDKALILLLIGVTILLVLKYGKAVVLQ